VDKQAFNVQSGFGRCLDKLATELAGESGTFLLRYLPLEGFVTLISDEHKDGVAALNAPHGLTKDFQPNKSRSGGNGINENESLTFPGKKTCQ
jgi:hypothetical protein